jgi:serine/threonine protein phosphatase PrpC
MSTHSHLPGLRGRIGLSALSLLCGLLFALQLILPSAAFATASEHTTTPAFDAKGMLDLAGVSVVRLVIDYTGTPNRASLECTGLGTVVGSWSPTSQGEKNNWILTDGALVNPNGQTCAPNPKINWQLTKIAVYANNVYTNNNFNLALLGTLLCQSVQGQKTACRDTAIETLTQPLSGAVLFSFHTDSSHLQPFLPVVAQQGAGLQLGIELENPNATSLWPTSPVLLGANSQPQLYLTPGTVNSPPGSQSATGTGTPVQGGLQSSASGEPGMPIVNSDGNVVGMMLTGGSLLPGQTIQSLLNQQPELQRTPQNTLNSTWDQGITQYELGEYSAARATLKEIDRANPQFRAALFFEGKAAAQLSHGTNGTPTTNGNGSQPATVTPGVFGTFLIVGLGAGLLLLILLLILVSMWTRRRHELARFETERIEAQRDADREVQQMRRSKATVNLQHPATELPCPNCGTLVQTTEAFCPHCRFLLSPSASGLHLRATPPPSIAPQPQANYMQPPVAPASSISDLPTMEFSPSNGSVDSGPTLPYNIQQLQGRNLSLAVGHLTDPGIKRKHKPNEDSLFAMQGSRTYNSRPQEFGLFVVADGMGGHANGQDASRLAIQTIIDYMLPKISTNNQMDDEAFLTLLRDGVQCANQAVHQRNLEERADMGTTMTAALVVGATAYVANVGDSRTYLYREPEGLTKITHDHSVVASLVEAGIIKPDDIYTHPKRNQIYRSLGEKPTVDVDSFRVPLQPGDKLLLCSDGLWDMIRDPEIQRLMSLPTPDPTKIGKDLIQAALEGGGEDNVSVIIVSFSEAPDPTKTGMTGVQLLAKPETVKVPDLPPM